ncbi:Metallo-peptidase family M12-domain-containing protein [Phellopilus nigrolimitatus]|nr:Metallo-peptidase family M12-domain-containing protein [Phellopilus nigrolimitatus]
MSVWLGHANHALVVLLLLCLVFVSASSVPPRPLKRVAHPSTRALEILPRQLPPPKALRTRASSPFINSPTLFHSDSFRLTFSAFDDVFHLHLRPNDHLIHPAARINYYKNGPGGRQVLDRSVPLLRESVRVYWGEVVAAEHSPERMREDAAGVLPRPSRQPGKELGWARIIVHSQGDAARGLAPVFEGAFEVDGVTHHVQTRENYLRNKLAPDPALVDGGNDPDARLVIWRDSDVLPHVEETRGGSQRCSHDTHEFNTDPWRNPVLRRPPAPPAWYDPLGMLSETATWANSSLAKRDDVAGGGSSNTFESSIGQTTGCPKSQKVLYMGVAADCAYVTAYSSTQNATMQILNDWNSASALYKSSFNVSLGIVQIDVQDPTCPTSAPADAPWNVGCDNTNVTLNDRLSLFSAWRGTKGDDGTGLWHLMSGCPTGTEVGVAWLGTLCQQTASGSTGSIVSGTAVSTNGRTEWEVVSHEVGHNFGAIHDCQDGCGTNSSPVCCPLTSSTCNANDAFIMSPVTSSTEKTFSQCSIGNICSLMVSTASGAVNATCLQDPDPSKVTLALNMCGNGIVESGEDCDPGQNTTSTCCVASTCKFASDPACDIAEMCTGNSSSCPSDQFKPNGQSCGSGELTCANGVCTSLNQQCQTVGASMNLTTACSKADNSCQVSCQDPSNKNQCIQLQSQLIDGSSCGFGGTCQSGTCKAGSVLDTVKSWYVQNLQIAIPVSVVGAIVILLLLWGLFLCIKRCRKSNGASMEPALVGRRGMRIPSWQPPPPPLGVRPPPSVPVSTRPQIHQPLMTVANINPRRSSVPVSLRPGGPNPNAPWAPPSAYAGGGKYNMNPPISPRNQSWDGVVNLPVAGSARMPGRNRPGSGQSGSSSRSRNPAFLQPRQRDESRWVDPTSWNGPL